jgi:hypothetical protein
LGLNWRAEVTRTIDFFVTHFPSSAAMFLERASLWVDVEGIFGFNVQKQTKMEPAAEDKMN